MHIPYKFIHTVWNNTSSGISNTDLIGLLAVVSMAVRNFGSVPGQTLAPGSGRSGGVLTLGVKKIVSGVGSWTSKLGGRSHRRMMRRTILGLFKGEQEYFRRIPKEIHLEHSWANTWYPRRLPLQFGLGHPPTVQFHVSNGRVINVYIYI